MRFYKPNKDYIKYLLTVDGKIRYTDNLIGIPLRLNELIYFLPVVSPQENDYHDGVLKKSTPTILRMVDLRTGIYYGKCLFSNMFAIPYKELKVIDMSMFDEAQLIFMENKIGFIKKNYDRILKGANRIFKQKSKGYHQEYLNATVDFDKVEKASLQWEITHYGKHYNRFPDEKFFLTNPNSKGVSEYYLMNKNKKIAKINFNNSSQKVENILEVINEEYAPLECLHNKKLDSNSITIWFKGRGIPSWRDGLDDFLDNLGIKNKDILLNKAYGLSLSDQYWLNPVERLMDWKDINFFDHDFNSQDYIEASFENKIIDNKNLNLYSPNNTSDGMLKKTWIVGVDQQRYLLKSSFRKKGLEPFNEVLSGMIANVLELNYVPYTIEIFNQNLLSKCKCFIDKDTEFISAYALLKSENVDMNSGYILVMENYIKILKDKGIQDVEEKIATMFILDYLMVNQDRHLGNFGIVRNVNTLEWLDITPNFDSGQSMFSQKEIYEMNFERVNGCFFNNKSVDFEKILELSLNMYSSFDINFEELEKVPLMWKDELLKYQYISLMSDEKINLLIDGLKLRITKLKNKLAYYLQG